MSEKFDGGETDGLGQIRHKVILCHLKVLKSFMRGWRQFGLIHPEIWGGGKVNGYRF